MEAKARGLEAQQDAKRRVLEEEARRMDAERMKERNLLEEESRRMDAELANRLDAERNEREKYNTETAEAKKKRAEERAAEEAEHERLEKEREEAEALQWKTQHGIVNACWVNLETSKKDVFQQLWCVTTPGLLTLYTKPLELPALMKMPLANSVVSVCAPPPRGSSHSRRTPRASSLLARSAKGRCAVRTTLMATGMA